MSFTRRSLSLGLVTASALAVATGPRWRGATAQTPQASPVAASDGGPEYLLVADQEAATVAFYTIPELALTGQFDGIVLDKHNGVLTLPDGRILVGDGASGSVLAVTLDQAGVPAISQQTAIEYGDGIAWSTVDPGFRYWAVTTGVDESTTRYLNLVDLETFTNTAIEFVSEAEEELEAWVYGDPATVFVSLGGRVEAFPLADLLAGSQEPTATVQVDLGSHGPVPDPSRDRWLVSTNPGFEVLDLAGGELSHGGVIPWDVDGFVGGRNTRPRLSLDGQHIFGVLTPPLDVPEQWAESEVSVHITDLEGDRARRVALGLGQYTGRWGISRPYALLAGHDGETGNAVLFDVDPDSPTFGEVVGTIAIELPTNHAVVGEPVTGKENYLTAITTDGSVGFVAHGGDGLITIIDTASHAITGQLETATPLVGAGYITVVQPGLAPVDLAAR